MGQPGTTQTGCLVNPTIIIIMKTAWKFMCGKDGMTICVPLLVPTSAKQQQINNTVYPTEILFLLLTSMDKSTYM